MSGMSKKITPKDKPMNHVDIRFDPVSAALRQMHEAVVSEPMPEDFLRILDDIDAKIAARKTTQ